MKPGKGAAFVRSKLKNYLTGNTVEKTFRAGEMVDTAVVERKDSEFTYVDGDEVCCTVSVCVCCTLCANMGVYMVEYAHTCLPLKLPRVFYGCWHTHTPPAHHHLHTTTCTPPPAHHHLHTTTTYTPPPQYVFMDMSTYEETRVKRDESWAKYLKEGMEAGIVSWNGKVISVEMPNTVELVVTETDPGVKGNTAQGGSKPATLESGAVIQVPLFIKEGERIRVDTRSDSYLGRVNE